MNSGNTSQPTLILMLVVFLLTGCGGSQVEPAATPAPPTTAPTPIPTTSTPTPTATLLLRANEQTPTPPGPSAGEVEIRIPFDIYGEGERLSADVPKCVNTIPFRMIRDGARTMIEGGGRIDCHFVDTPQGAPIVFHVVLKFDGALNGELLPATSDKPSGWLDAYLALDGAVTQYYVGYPAGAPNPCPESNPCRIPSADVIPIPLAYKEGSTVATPWIFILHLR
jgi:hypothetical protein